MGGVTLTGNSSANTLTGGGEEDTISGNGGNDVLSGGNGNDTINGGAGADTLTGGAGIDTLNGGNGNDLLIGGAGADRLTGGAGVDRYDYNAITEGLDTITGFVRGASGDKLDIRDVLVGYTAGANINNFVQLSGGASTTVSVNADGVGTDFVALATLQNVTMTASLLNDMLASSNLVVS
jgi:Ca2+-binding RTX toxin-like protein